MKNKIITLAVLREARIDENRTPLSPAQVSIILNKFSNIKIIVQPSNRRCFKDEDYQKAGAQITDDLSSANIIFGVKEVDISALIEGKTYLFFSHTSKVSHHIGEIIKDKTYLESVLAEGVENAHYRARKTLSKVYRKVGFIPPKKIG